MLPFGVVLLLALVFCIVEVLLAAAGSKVVACRELQRHAGVGDGWRGWRFWPLVVLSDVQGAVGICARLAVGPGAKTAVGAVHTVVVV